MVRVGIGVAGAGRNGIVRVTLRVGTVAGVFRHVDGSEGWCFGREVYGR